MWKAWFITHVSHRYQRRDERGEITQTVIITALFAAAAIVICGIIIAKFTGKAESISTG